jgi:hypothetical protein
LGDRPADEIAAAVINGLFAAANCVAATPVDSQFAKARIDSHGAQRPEVTRFRPADAAVISI